MLQRRYGSDPIVVVTCNKTPVRIFLASLKSNSNNNVSMWSLLSFPLPESAVAGTIVTHVEQACLPVCLLDGALTCWCNTRGDVGAVLHN